MNNKIAALTQAVEEFAPKSLAEVEEFRIKMVGKKGEMTALMDEFKTVAPELKREFGQKLNALKNSILTKINEQKELLEQSAASAPQIDDMSRPGSAEQLGSRHPISLVKQEIIDIFSRLGYTVADGPEIEDDNHVFSRLNFPMEHPARDMQDTFYLAENLLLRTQTSAAQIRTMETRKPPIRVVCPGRVFRADEVDATHSPVFHQMEGLVVDKGITMCDLKGVLEQFAREIYGPETRVKFRPSFFPFTEPSVEVDVSCSECGGKGCRVCKGAGWIEILGAGMVHPRVLESCGIDPNVYSGFAFGIGLDRLTTTRHKISDIRSLFENDQRFLEQF